MQQQAPLFAMGQGQPQAGPAPMQQPGPVQGGWQGTGQAVPYYPPPPGLSAYPLPPQPQQYGPPSGAAPYISNAPPPAQSAPPPWAAAQQLPQQQLRPPPGGGQQQQQYGRPWQAQQGGMMPGGGYLPPQGPGAQQGYNPQAGSTAADAAAADTRPRPSRGHYSSKPQRAAEGAPEPSGLAAGILGSQQEAPEGAASSPEPDAGDGLGPAAMAQQRGAQPPLQEQQQQGSFAGPASFSQAYSRESSRPQAAVGPTALPQGGGLGTPGGPGSPLAIPQGQGQGRGTMSGELREQLQPQRAPLILEDRALAPTAGSKRAYESLGFSTEELYSSEPKRREVAAAGDSEGVQQQQQQQQPRGKETVYRLILNLNDTALLIGKGGTTIRQIERETGARVKRLQEPPGCDEQVLVIWSPEQPSNAGDRVNSAQRALMDCSQRVVLAANPRSVAGASGRIRMLISRTQELAVVGRGGSTINSIRSESGAGVKVLMAHQLPPCALANDLLVEIEGAEASTLRAIELLSQVLKESPPGELPAGAPASLLALPLPTQGSPARMAGPPAGGPPQGLAGPMPPVGMRPPTGLMGSQQGMGMPQGMGVPPPPHMRPPPGSLGSMGPYGSPPQPGPAGFGGGGAPPPRGPMPGGIGGFGGGPLGFGGPSPQPRPGFGGGAMPPRPGLRPEGPGGYGGMPGGYR